MRGRRAGAIGLLVMVVACTQAAEVPGPSTPSLRPIPSPASSAPSGSADLAPSGATQTARVVTIVDGDTIRVQVGGVEERLRYIGIDTPERGDAFFDESTELNRELVEGRELMLETDVSDRDRYGRLLRHVWLAREGGWVLVNLELVRRGYAVVSTYPPDVKYVDRLVEAQQRARGEGLGVWGPEPEAFLEARAVAGDQAAGGGSMMTRCCRARVAPT